MYNMWWCTKWTHREVQLETRPGKTFTGHVTSLGAQGNNIRYVWGSNGGGEGGGPSPVPLYHYLLDLVMGFQ